MSPAMADPDDPLGRPGRASEAARIRSRKLSDGVATLIVDATGLSDEASATRWSSELQHAALALAGVDEVRVAMTAVAAAPDA